MRLGIALHRVCKRACRVEQRFAVYDMQNHFIDDQRFFASPKMTFYDALSGNDGRHPLAEAQIQRHESDRLVVH